MSYIEVKLSRRAAEAIVEALQLECNLALYEERLELATEYAELRTYFEKKLNGEQDEDCKLFYSTFSFLYISYHVCSTKSRVL